jgi:hypothetical protein
MEPLGYVFAVAEVSLVGGLFQVALLENVGNGACRT